MIFLSSKYSFKLIHSTSESINFFWPLFYVYYSRTGNFNIFGINNNETFIFQVLTFFSPLGEKFNFSIPWDFEAKGNLNRKASKIMSNLTRASKHHLNDKSLINGQETASIFKFSAENFELN